MNYLIMSLLFLYLCYAVWKITEKDIHYEYVDTIEHMVRGSEYRNYRISFFKSTLGDKCYSFNCNNNAVVGCSIENDKTYELLDDCWKKLTESRKRDSIMYSETFRELHEALSELE